MRSILHCILLFLITSPAFSQLQTNVPKLVENEVIVRMQKGENPSILVRLAPENFELKVEKVLSQHSDIWLLSFDDSNTTVERVVEELGKINTVYLVQPNHEVTLRQAPNDPLFSNQWQHDNIDSELAWDITTGGTTPNGTDVVVALIESADLSHPDLQDNQWKNTAEIPGNGIDDDGNGYVDDYNGWNVSSNNDNIGTGSHGTSCAGMIGAKGDNNLGVAGINWNVKIMDIAGYNSPFTEANIVEAYNYALQARLLWNNSGGTAGAFVVATSASWGVDYGDPNDYPIWCGFYEDLGEQGILNAGATSNQNINIDVTGDVPSACPSDYMIGVTATNSSDVIDFAGYGQTTINVAAPGSSIYTTAPNGGYTSTSGTSFATPLTAGLIGLLYSVPCSNLESMAISDPQGTADIVRQALFDGVDQNTYLMTRTTTGGRINARNSIDLLMAEVCSSCSTPLNVSVSSLTNYEATIDFEINEEAEDYTIHLQVAGSDNWETYTSSTNSFTFEGLTSCTDYEYYVTANCEEEASNPSSISTFSTSGCGNCVDLNFCETSIDAPVTGLRIFNPSSIEGSMDYTPTTNFGGSVSAGYNYGELVLATDGTTDPDLGCDPFTNGSEINGNIAVIVRGSCNFTDKVMNAQNAGATAAIIVNNVSSAPIDMGGTNNAITIPAIMISQSNGNALISAINNNEQPRAILGKQNEWIESFELDGNVNTSGDNSGYLLSSIGTELVLGETYSFTLTPGFGSQPLPEYTRIWIDLNQDGNFDNSDLVYDQNASSELAVTDNLTVPATALTGSTRMRVQMAFQEGTSPTLPTNCGAYSYGEVEDYCVTISSGEYCNIEVESTVSQPTCSEVKDGELTVEPTGGTFTFLWNNGNTSNSISNLGANNYSVTITNESGCDTTLYYSLAYTRDLQIDETITQPSCTNTEDGEISLEVTGGDSYSFLWNNGSTSASNSNLGQGNYEVTVTDELGCTKAASYTLVAPTVSAPIAAYNFNSTLLAVQFNNTSSNATSYYWDFGDGNSSTDTNPAYTFDEAGTYTVCLTAYGPCDTITTCKNIAVSDGTSGVDEEEANNLTIFPNPAKDKITLHSTDKSIKEARIFNTNGQFIQSVSLKGESTNIKVDKWATGIYFFHIIDDFGKVISVERVAVMP